MVKRCLLAVVLASCGEGPTQVIVVTDSDVAGLDRIRAVVTAPDTTTQSSVANLGPGQAPLPRSLALLWEQGPLGPFTVQLTGESGGTTRVERAARFDFQRGRTVVLRMNLLARCAGIACGAMQTCGEAGCRSIDVAPSELEPFTGQLPGLDAGRVPDGGRDGGPPMECTTDAQCGGLDRPCARGVCMMPSGRCVSMPVADGTACDDGSACTDGDVCTAGACGGTPLDCGGDTCSPSTCDEAMGACVSAAPLPDGSACDDAFACTTAGTCLSGACQGTADEAGCGAGEICNPVAYPGMPSGCGPAPSMLALSCAAPAAGAARCTLDLGVAGEAGRISCTARPTPVQLFADAFDAGFAAAWTTVSGTPTRTMIPGATQAAAANGASWESEVMLPARGLSSTCVDFRVAQANAAAGERIRWDVAFDGGAFTTVFDLDFATWESGDITYRFNRNVCAPVPMGATTMVWRLRMDSDMPQVWVDDVVVSGVAAPRTIPANGGPDDMTSMAGWTFAGGMPPYLGMFGGSSVMFAETRAFTATRAAIDASACDVLDVDFDFGYAPGANALDPDDDIRLEVSVGGGAFMLVELLNLANGAWNANGAALPWLRLRRITDIVPAAAGASSVVLRFRLSADNGGERVWIDDFEVGCADLPDPMLGPISDAGGGSYTFDVGSTAPIGARIQCTWRTSDDGPLVGRASVQLPP